MNSRQLTYLAAIYEHGTLTKAADHVRVATSALSHHLANLEDELSTKLFTRLPRRMQPTAAGDRLYVHAKAILRAMAAAEEDLREIGGEVSGEVSLGLSFSAVRAIGTNLIKKVLSDHPRVKLSMSENLSGANLVDLMKSDVDLALVFNPPHESGLKSTPVLEEKLICVGRKEIIGDTHAPIRFSDMLELPIIVLRQGLSARAILDDVTLLRRLEEKAKLQINSVNAITSSLVEGLGCVIGTKLFMQEPIDQRQLHFRPIIEPELSRTLHICELAERPPTVALETVREIVLTLIAESIQDNVWDATLL